MSRLSDSFLKSKRKSSLASHSSESTSPDYIRREVAKSVLPEGYSLMDHSSKTANYWGGSSSFGSGGNSMFHTQKPYLPEFDSPDRPWYPDDRCEANKYWRLFYKSDPVFGTAVDMYASMMVSDFEITISNDQDSSIKRQLEDMAQTVNLQRTFQDMVTEFLGVGEAVPHCTFNNSKGIWDKVTFHDPDYIDVIDPYMINSDSLLYFIPPDTLKELLMDNTPESMEIRRTLPAEFVSKVLSNQKIRLSPLNCTFIPRKLHPYDVRGTSLASRLWRINMVEDAVYTSTIATYRRHAAPLKVIKMGDSQTGFIPGPDMQRNILEMVNQAEIDPQTWIATNYAVNFETWGNTNQAISINREWSTIEQIKLVALGLSKSVLSGDTSFAAVKSGIQVLLRKLLSMRQFFESVWLYPKFFKPIIDINDWQKSTRAEVDHRIRIKRTGQEAREMGLSIEPKIRWKNRLDSTVDTDLLTAISQLNNLGFKVSLQTVGSAVGLNWKEEEEKRAAEFLEQKRIREKVLGPTMSAEMMKEDQQGAGAKPPGSSGSGAKPPGSTPPSNGGKSEVSTPPGNSDSGGTLSDTVESPSETSIG